MAADNLLPLEQHVLDALLKGEHPILHALREQLAHVQRVTRKQTGAGFYVHFHLPDSVVGLHERFDIRPNFQFGDVSATLYPAQQEAGFLLFIREGLLSFLEGYVYDDEMQATVESFAIKYIDGERDISKLEREWLKKVSVIELKQPDETAPTT